jgi:hypothetical protein
VHARRDQEPEVSAFAQGDGHDVQPSLQVQEAYADLLRDTRGLRREQAAARDAWYAALSWERKEDTLFELEILLKGLACFANPRNHPGARQRKTVVSLDFRDALGSRATA